MGRCAAARGLGGRMGDGMAREGGGDGTARRARGRAARRLEVAVEDAVRVEVLEAQQQIDEDRARRGLGQVGAAGRQVARVEHLRHRGESEGRSSQHSRRAEHGARGI